MNFNDPEDDDRELDPGAEHHPDAEGDSHDGGEDEGDDEIGFIDDDPDIEGEGDDLPKRLRARINEQGHVIATMSRRLAEASETVRPAPIEVGERPTLESCDYDEDRFARETDAWTDRKLAAAQAERDTPRNAEDEARADVERYQTSIAKLTYADAEAAIGRVREALTPQQEFMISQASNDAGRLLYALSRNPGKLADLVGIKNPAKFLVRVATLEANMKTGTRRAAPNPERIPRGNAPARSAGADKEEQRLEKEADRTGDRTALIRYRKQKRANA